MYNHCYLSDHSVAFKEKAQAIVLSPKLPSDTWPVLASLLDSSSVLFVLKQICFNKGPGKQGQQDRFEFSGNILGELKIPESVSQQTELRAQLAAYSNACSLRGKEASSLGYERLFEMPGEAYDGWNRSLSGYTAPHRLIAQSFGTAEELLALKIRAKEERERLRQEIIALQEEMDWLTYAAYGLLDRDHAAVGMALMDARRPWCVALGQRAFELAAIQAGPPTGWEEKRKKLWRARLGTLQINEDIKRIEQLIYKRRWVQPNYEEEFGKALRGWLREKAEFFLEKVVEGGPISLSDWAAALWKDSRVRAAAAAYHDESVANAKKFEPILKEAIEEETVPDDDSAFKSHHKQLRGKLNIPRERFRSLTSEAGYYVWAGKQEV
jgi:hypothetical protein